MSNIFDLFRSIEQKSEPAGAISYLIVGLGNPGAEYEGTRHNAGFLAVDTIAAKHGARIDRAKFKALVGECVMDGVRVLLMKPETFMNLSGEAVAAAASFYKLPPENVIVICDDISFAPGHLRIRRKGSAGGHNGLKSIISCLGSDAFVRFRLGVGQKPHPEYDLADWVLGKIPASDREAMKTGAENAASAALLWVAGKTDAALSSYSK